MDKKKVIPLLSVILTGGVAKIDGQELISNFISIKSNGAVSLIKGLTETNSFKYLPFTEGLKDESRLGQLYEKSYEKESYSKEYTRGYDKDSYDKEYSQHEKTYERAMDSVNYSAIIESNSLYDDLFVRAEIQNVIKRYG